MDYYKIMPTLLKFSLSVQVIDLIKERIRQGELRPGDRVSEVKIADECNISRAPVREALFALEMDGFLSSDSKRSKFVTPVTPEVIMNNYELCALLEGQAVFSSSLQLKNPHINQIEKVLEAMKNNKSKLIDSEDSANLSTEFHQLITENAENRLLVETAKKYGRVFSKFLMYTEWKSIYTKDELYFRHLELYKAMLTQNEVHIKKAVQEHYLDSADKLIKCIKK